MTHLVHPPRSKPAPLPPAAGTFGIAPLGEPIKLHSYHPVGCPSLEQFEARFIFANKTPAGPSD